jgi:hypothetical protein
MQSRSNLSPGNNPYVPPWSAVEKLGWRAPAWLPEFEKGRLEVSQVGDFDREEVYWSAVISRRPQTARAEAKGGN